MRQHSSMNGLSSACPCWQVGSIQYVDVMFEPVRSEVMDWTRLENVTGASSFGQAKESNSLKRRKLHNPI